jgi:hypothetical protein
MKVFVLRVIVELRNEKHSVSVKQSVMPIAVVVVVITTPIGFDKFERTD